jgi:hypothetical protein
MSWKDPSDAAWLHASQPAKAASCGGWQSSGLAASSGGPQPGAGSTITGGDAPAEDTGPRTASATSREATAARHACRLKLPPRRTTGPTEP